MATEDRTVHATHPSGTEIVRYDRAGAWYLETGEGRKRVSVSEAARLAVNLRSNGGTIHLGKAGGAAFDARVGKEAK